MKKSFFLLLMVAFVATAFNFKNTKYVVNVAESKLAWVGKKVTGEHNGLISLKSGNLEMKNGKLVGGAFSIDMNSITCLDLENAEYNQKLVGHLKSDDFFGTANFPTADLTIKKVQAKGNNTYSVTADLTIKGITHESVFDVTTSEEGGNLKATATIVVNRAKYEVKYRSGSFFDNLGDKMIYDDFTLTVTLSAKPA